MEFHNIAKTDDSDCRSRSSENIGLIVSKVYTKFRPAGECNLLLIVMNCVALFLLTLI